MVEIPVNEIPSKYRDFEVVWTGWHPNEDTNLDKLRFVECEWRATLVARGEGWVFEFEMGARGEGDRQKVLGSAWMDMRGAIDAWYLGVFESTGRETVH